MTGDWLLPALIAVPLAGATILLLGGQPARRWAWGAGVAVTGVDLVLSLLVVASFDVSRSGTAQHLVDVPWLPALGVHVRLGVDGLSLPLVVLTCLLCFLCAIYSLRHRPEGGSSRAYVGLFLLIQAGLVGTFVALDLLLFFVFFEVVLAPMWFVIAFWGGTSDRRRSATVFVLYTVLGSIVMLAGFLVVWAATGTTDVLQLASAAGTQMSRSTQLLAALLVGLGLAVKVPMWPLHTWLPDAHTAAPTAGSVLLAGVMLKIGSYGLVRIVLPVLPDATRALAPYLAGLAVVGVVYGALASYAQRDLKRLVAFSSVGHMGFVLLGIATLTTVGVNGAMFGNVAHGLVTGLLFLVAGSLKEREPALDLVDGPRSWYARTPRLGFLLGFGAVATLGLPGLAGFWGEFLPLLGTYRPGVVSHDLYRPLLVLAAVGTLLATAYALRVLRMLGQGPGTTARAPDLDVVEASAAAPLVLLVVLLGLVPSVLLGVTGPVAEASVSGARTALVEDAGG